MFSVRKNFVGGLPITHAKRICCRQKIGTFVFTKMFYFSRKNSVRFYANMRLARNRYRKADSCCCLPIFSALYFSWNAAFKVQNFGFSRANKLSKKLNFYCFAPISLSQFLHFKACRKTQI
jgi:hypothetical protein